MTLLDAEASELGLRTGLPCTELDTPVREQVEGGDALGHTGRVVEIGRQLNDSVTDPDAARALAHRAEEDLGCRRVRVLLQEVVLDLPDVVEAERVRELYLIERVLRSSRARLRPPTAAEAGARRRSRSASGPSSFRCAAVAGTDLRPDLAASGIRTVAPGQAPGRSRPQSAAISGSSQATPELVCRVVVTVDQVPRARRR